MSAHVWCRTGPASLVLCVCLLALSCANREPGDPGLTDISRPQPGVLPYFRGRIMDPYWPAGQALPCDLRHLRDLKLTSHHGRAFTFREVRGRFTLVVFFYASCSGICPLITSNMKALSAKIQEQADLQILSITVNPELDDPESLRAYLEHHAVTQENWTFLTGPRQQIEALAREQFGGDVRTREGLEGLLDFVHTENVYLVDKEGYLRGIYRGRGTGDLLRLLQDLAKLRSASKA